MDFRPVGIGYDPQVADDVLDLLPLEEARAARHDVGNVRLEEGFLRGAAEGVGADEHAEVRVAPFFVHPDRLDHLGDEVGFLGFVFGDINLDGLARAVARPEGFFLPVGVVTDDAVRRGEDRFGRAVILFELDFPQARKVPLEHFNVLVVRPAPGIYRLVVVAYDTDVPVCHQVHELVLLYARVLEFVHHYVLEPFPVFFEDVGMFAEEPYGKDDEVVEVHRIVELEARLVFLVELAVLVVRALPGPTADLYVREKAADLVHVEGVRGEAEVASRFLDELVAVHVIVDAEVFAPAELVDVVPEDAHPEGMESADGEHLEFLPGQFLHPLGHFARSLVGEGEGEDLGLGDSLVEHVGHAEGYDAGLAGTGARDDEHRAFYRCNCGVLFVIELGTVVMGHRKRSIARMGMNNTAWGS